MIQIGASIQLIQAKQKSKKYKKKKPNACQFNSNARAATKQRVVVVYF